MLKQSFLSGISQPDVALNGRRQHELREESKVSALGPLEQFLVAEEQALNGMG